ncbi:MAG: inositol phosphorylceramide synthase [Cyclobacteriaceae bacterium]|nr:inositol phosphorylceramide synthase [Cyclobacteriaceae bacterium]
MQTEIRSSIPSLKQCLIASIVSFTYLLVSYLLIGFRNEQLILAFIFVSLYLASPLSRKFILGFSVFIVFWIIFDYMKAFPNYQFADVNIQSLYRAERSLFGISIGNTTLTPNEYWESNHSPFLDVMSGFFYLCWVPVPLMFAFLLFLRNRNLFLQFSLTFLLVNLIGFVIYYLYPAAPPWFVQHHGFDFIANTPGNTAGLARFDEFFNISLFHSMYAKSSNVFAAMPSLHSAYPLIVFYYGLKAELGWINLLFAIIIIGIWFAAVYTGHHYVLDVLAGIACASIGISLFKLLRDRNERFKAFLNGYTRLIS